MRNLKSLLVAGAALAMVASPAAAQWYGGGYSYNAPPPPYGYGERDERPLRRAEIVDRLEDRGFEDIGRPRFDGSVYVVEASTRRGGAVRLVVDAFSGRILRETPLSTARLEPFDDGLEVDAYGSPPRRGAYPPAEMPNAPRYRPGEPEGPLDRQAARPLEPDVAVPSPGSRSRPADPRLAPDAPAARAAPAEPEPRREARRPASPDAGVSPGEVLGVNPDSRRAATPAPKPKPDIAAKPAPSPAEKPAAPSPAARTSPSAPAPTTASRPAAPGPTTAEAGERKVRVIEGVTPMNGGQQASPAPQNNVEAGAKPAQPGTN